MELLPRIGRCDCHSHVFGPFADFPLSSRRTFDPPESPIEELEKVWQTVGIDRAVLVQGSAHGNDHAALLAALARSPKTRRGVALLQNDVTDATLTALQKGGIRAVRFNWIHHLIPSHGCSEQQRLADAAELLQRVSSLGWHAEIHIDVADLELVTRLSAPRGMPIVIDHMGRLDLSSQDSSSRLRELLRVLERDSFWVKLSGADRMAANCTDLEAAVQPMRQILKAAPDRCVWGLDWPHVNVARKRSDVALTNLLLEVAGDGKSIKQIMIHNPARLYGFDLEAA
jgi:2-pyrone-4,6-dicarboxylate lactonase